MGNTILKNLTRRIVITGMGTINPLGNTVEEYWDNLIQGKSGIRRLKNVVLKDYSVQIGGEIDLPDVTEYFKSKKMLRRLDRYIIFTHIAGMQALRDSGLEVEKNAERYGSLMGTGAGGVQAHLTNIKRICAEKFHGVSPFYVINAIPSTGTAYFAQEAGLKGSSFSVNSACASGNHAIGISFCLIKMGMADAIVAGGSEAVVNEAGLTAFGNIMALSARNDSPETASRPFDKDRDGFVISEGAGVLVLEELEHAQKRGAHIYAEISGIGFSCDAHDLVAPHPEGEGAQRAITLALESAELNQQDIDLINCHGTSTTIGDLSESKAINSALGEYGSRVPVHSTKSMLGHLLGGASTVEAIGDIMAFEKNIIHPTINQFEQDPEIHLNVVKETREDKNINHILSNAFGFGGQNAVIILSRFKD